MNLFDHYQRVGSACYPTPTGIALAICSVLALSASPAWADYSWCYDYDICRDDCTRYRKECGNAPDQGRLKCNRRCGIPGGKAKKVDSGKSKPSAVTKPAPKRRKKPKKANHKATARQKHGKTKPKPSVSKKRSRKAPAPSATGNNTASVQLRTRVAKDLQTQCDRMFGQLNEQLKKNIFDRMTSAENTGKDIENPENLTLRERVLAFEIAEKFSLEADRYFNGAANNRAYTQFPDLLTVHDQSAQRCKAQFYMYSVRLLASIMDILPKGALSVFVESSELISSLRDFCSQNLHSEDEAKTLGDCFVVRNEILREEGRERVCNLRAGDMFRVPRACHVHQWLESAAPDACGPRPNRRALPGLVWPKEERICAHAQNRGERYELLRIAQLDAGIALAARVESWSPAIGEDTTIDPVKKIREGVDAVLDRLLANDAKLEAKAGSGTWSSSLRQEREMLVAIARRIRTMIRYLDEDARSKPRPRFDEGADAWSLYLLIGASTWDAPAPVLNEWPHRAVDVLGLTALTARVARVAQQRGDDEIVRRVWQPYVQTLQCVPQAPCNQPSARGHRTVAWRLWEQLPKLSREAFVLGIRESLLLALMKTTRGNVVDTRDGQIQVADYQDMKAQYLPAPASLPTIPRNSALNYELHVSPTPGDEELCRTHQNVDMINWLRAERPVLEEPLWRLLDDDETPACGVHALTMN